MKRTQLGAAVALTLTLSFGATLAQAATLDIKTASIADFNAAYASGKVTSAKVVEAYLKRIEAFDKKGPTIKSVSNLLIAQALHQAAQPASVCHGNAREKLLVLAAVIEINYFAIHFLDEISFHIVISVVPTA